MRVALGVFVILYVPFAAGFRMSYASSSNSGTYNILSDPIWLSCLFIAGLLVLVGSVFPDKLEPARHWTHRAKWHSSRLLVRFSILCFITMIISAVLPEVLPVSAFLFGYVIHLMMDSQTKMGLPS